VNTIKITLSGPTGRLPTSLHWLGDRISSDETRQAMDRKGCVLYFETEEACHSFMKWLTNRYEHYYGFNKPID